jgi:hypothetical protein
VVTLSVSKTVKVRKGKKTIHKRVTVIYGRVSYSAKSGKTDVVVVTLDSAGRRALAAAKGKHLSVTVTVTVSGGKTVKGTVVLKVAAAKPPKKKH